MIWNFAQLLSVCILICTAGTHLHLHIQYIYICTLYFDTHNTIYTSTCMQFVKVIIILQLCENNKCENNIIHLLHINHQLSLSRITLCDQIMQLNLLNYIL